MPHPAYSYRSGHQTRRAQLLKELRAIGAAVCLLCGDMMTVEMELHLHHSNPDMKRLGLPGDVLTHAKCNMSEGGRRNGKGKRSRASRQW